MTKLILFLLVSSFIGAIIGWLFRGSCKKTLHSSNKRWSKKLIKNNCRWNEKVDQVKRDYARNISKLNQEYLFIQNLLNKKESSWEEKKKNLIRNNDELTIMNKKMKSMQVQYEDQLKELNKK